MGVVALVQACNQRERGREREKQERGQEREQEKQERERLAPKEPYNCTSNTENGFRKVMPHSHSHEEQEKAEYLDDDHHACHEAVVGVV